MSQRLPTGAKVAEEEDVEVKEEEVLPPLSVSLSDANASNYNYALR